MSDDFREQARTLNEARRATAAAREALSLARDKVLRGRKESQDTEAKARAHFRDVAARERGLLDTLGEANDPRKAVETLSDSDPLLLLPVRIETRFKTITATGAVRHELWDGNIQDHPDQGVAILVVADVAGKETTLLRFNCFDFERSYIYGPENADLRVEGPAMLGGAATTNLYRMDSTVDGNPIGWTIRTLGTKLPRMLGRAGYPQIAELVDMAAVTAVLPDVEASARELRATKRNTVKHNRGTHIFEAGNIRFGLEMRRLAMGDGGLAIHVLADIGGTPGKKYTEETELLAFDHFWNGAHYHYGPRNKNHRIYWDRTLVEDPLAWTLEQFEKGKLPAMIERAGYPGVAADLDVEKIASVLPAMKKQALDMWEQGRRLTGHPGLPLEPTPNLGAAD